MTKLDLISIIKSLPDDVLSDKIYFMDIIGKKIIMQHDSFFTDFYKAYKDKDQNTEDVVISYSIRGWSIKVEIN